MPVGGSVDEGVAILLVLRGAMSERPRAPAVCICAAAAWGCPRALVSGLAACVVGHYLAYKTTSKQSRSCFDRGQ